LVSFPVHRIGRIEKGEGGEAEWAFLEINGELKPIEARGWDHFK